MYPYVFYKCPYCGKVEYHDLGVTSYYTYKNDPKKWYERPMLYLLEQHTISNKGCGMFLTPEYRYNEAYWSKIKLPLPVRQLEFPLICIVEEHYTGKNEQEIRDNIMKWIVEYFENLNAFYEKEGRKQRWDPHQYDANEKEIKDSLHYFFKDSLKGNYISIPVSGDLEQMGVEWKHNICYD